MLLTGIIGNLFNTLTGGAGTEAYGQTKDALTSFFEKEDRAKENIDKGSGQFKGIGTIDKEVTNNAINNVVASNMPVNTQAMYNVLSRDPSKLDAFEFMARPTNMGSYPGARSALDEFYNENTL